MKTLFVTVFLVLMSIIFSQNNFDQDMKHAITQFEKTESPEQFAEMGKNFEQIVQNYPKEWEPRYYAILGKTISTFSLPAQEAFEVITDLENDYASLLELKENDEIIILKGLILTAKVAKDPMTYGQVLTSKILTSYHIARKLNPANPRALFELAKYQINAAPYMGNDPKSFCPLLQESILLFEQEAQTKKKGYEPRWGQDKAEQLYETTCVK